MPAIEFSRFWRGLDKKKTFMVIMQIEVHGVTGEMVYTNGETNVQIAIFVEPWFQFIDVKFNKIIKIVIYLSSRLAVPKNMFIIPYIFIDFRAMKPTVRKM